MPTKVPIKYIETETMEDGWQRVKTPNHPSVRHTDRGITFLLRLLYERYKNVTFNPAKAREMASQCIRHYRFGGPGNIDVAEGLSTASADWHLYAFRDWGTLQRKRNRGTDNRPKFLYRFDLDRMESFLKKYK